MEVAAKLQGPYSDVDAALIPPAELASHYDRRFSSFEEECAEHVERISERRLLLRAHHGELAEVEQLRRKVGFLQRRLAEVEVQSAKERIRALALDSEHKDLHISRREHRDEIRRLLAVKRAQAAEASPSAGLPSGLQEGSSLPPGASRSLMRLVETPGGGEDIESPAELWTKIHAEVQELTQGLEVFDVNRAEGARKHAQEVALLEAQLGTELSGLESERERLADALLGFVQLRSQHLALQRKHAVEMEVLKSCNRELLTRAEDLSSKGKQKVEQVAYLCKQDAVEHVEYRRVAETLERQSAGVAKACLEDLCEARDERVAGLENETRALKERCAASRRRRKLALDGLRADLSLAAEKLAVLEHVAEQVSSGLGRKCIAGVEGAASSRALPGSQATYQPRPRQATTSPYARRPLGASRSTRPPRSGAQSCGAAVARGSMRSTGAAAMPPSRGVATAVR